MKYYLYLAKRDKKGIKVLTTFPGKEFPATKINDLSTLNLPEHLEKPIEKEIYDNRMLWEPWFEGAESYNDLVDSLKKRGYRNLPLHSGNKYKFSKQKFVKNKSDIDNPKIDLKKDQKKTMIRRKN